MTNRPVDRPHFPALDGLRGVAVLGVLAHHFGQHFPSLRHWLWGGWSGVDLFFVLSGFLITGILLDTKHGPYYWQRFYFRRILRIFPLYYLVLLTVLCLLPALPPFQTPEIGGIISRQGWLWSHTSNILIGLEQTWPFRAGWLSLNHTWSLAIEEQFYLVWPWLVLVLDRRRLAWACAGMVVGSLILRFGMTLAGFSTLANYVWTPCRLDSLAIGALIALITRSPAGPAKLRALAPKILAGTGFLLAGTVLATQGFRYLDQPFATFGFTLLALFFGAVVVLCLDSHPATGWLNNLFLRRTGQYSYGIYLFHHLLSPLYLNLFPPAQLVGWLGSDWGGGLLFLGLACACTWLIAMTSFHLLEAPLLGLCHRWPPTEAANARQSPT